MGHSLGHDPNATAGSSGLVAERAAERMSMRTNSASNAQGVEGCVRGKFVASSCASERMWGWVEAADVAADDTVVMGVMGVGPKEDGASVACVAFTIGTVRGEGEARREDGAETLKWLLSKDPMRVAVTVSGVAYSLSVSVVGVAGTGGESV